MEGTLATLRPRTHRGKATRERILGAAEAEFGERGFHAASVSSITARAGVAQGTFYLYFPTKEDCFCTLVREVGHALRRRMGSAVAQGRTRLEGERLGMRAFLDFAHEHAGLYRIVEEAQFVDPAVYREYYERLATGYAAALRSATDRGELSDGDAETRAWAIMGVGHFIGMRYCLWNGEHASEQVLDAVMDFIERGIAPPSGIKG